jgi:signal transduction histidine kinase
MMGDELPVQQAARGIVVKDLEYDVAFADGTIRHMLGNARPLLDGQGRPRGSVAAFVDITERKRMEDVIRHAHDELNERVRERTAEVVRANEQLKREILERQQSQTALEVERDNFRKLSKEFQTLLNAISDTLVLFSPEMEILWTNCGNAHQSNEPPSEGVGQYCQALLRDLSAPSEDSPVARCFNTGEKEVSVLTHNGAVLDIRAFPIKEGDRVSRVFLLASDITEKMALQAEAMQACHLATLGELAAGIAHEINNPIMGIINYGQILINECSAVSLEKDLGKRIVKEGERIGRIVQTLLSYARDDERERKKPTPVSAILEESLILTQAQMRKESIDLKIKLLDDLPEVDVNFQQIQQSFINIISNARYALNEKYPGRHKNKVLEITGEKVILSDRPYVRIVFHDHGVGISPHELPMLTKAFFSTKPSGKGTGLGLNITDRIITDHGGSLGFESLKGEFTKVIIDLPAKVKNECQDSSH